MGQTDGLLIFLHLRTDYKTSTMQSPIFVQNSLRTVARKKVPAGNMIGVQTGVIIMKDLFRFN